MPANKGKAIGFTKGLIAELGITSQPQSIINDEKIVNPSDYNSDYTNEADDVPEQWGGGRPARISNGFPETRNIPFTAGFADLLNGNNVVTGVSRETAVYSAPTSSLIFGDGNDQVIGSGGSDPLPVPNSGGVYNDENASILLGDGDDIVEGTSSNAGILNNKSALIDGGHGNNIIKGDGAGRNTGLLNRDGASIKTKSGNDLIQGTDGGSGIVSSGTIETGGGNDQVIGSGGQNGIVNTGIIKTGKGDDTLLADAEPTGLIKGTAYGIWGGSGSKINTGDGDDRITGNAGNQGAIGTGIYLESTSVIKTGDGNDLITGQGGQSLGYATDTKGVTNLGTIDMGDGDDRLIAQIGGFGGKKNRSTGQYTGGTYKMGSGDDSVTGFGAGNFSGDDGNDQIRLTDGTYILSWDSTTETGALTNTSVNNTSMNLTSFELIGGHRQTTDSLLGLNDGSSTIIVYNNGADSYYLA